MRQILAGAGRSQLRGRPHVRKLSRLRAPMRRCPQRPVRLYSESEAAASWLSYQPIPYIVSACVRPALLQELGHQCSPSRLVRGAQPGASLAVKIFKKAHQISPVRIALKFFDRAAHRAASVFVAQKDAAQRPRKLRRNLPERQLAPRAGREFYLQFIAKIVMKSLQGLDDQEIHREPHRTSPIGVPAKCAGARLCRLVTDPVFVSHHAQSVRMIEMKARKRADTMRREKLLLVH